MMTLCKTKDQLQMPNLSKPTTLPEPRELPRGKIDRGRKASRFLRSNSRADLARRESSSRLVMMTKTSSEETRNRQVHLVKEASRLAAPTTVSNSSRRVNSKSR